MTYKRITWGIVLIFIGLMFALRNFGIVSFNWHMVISLWPLIIVIWGISLLPVKEWAKLVISLVITVAAFIIVIYTGGSGNSFFCRHKQVVFNKECRIQKMNLPFDSNITRARLEFDAAAGEFNIDSLSADLIDFNREGNIGNFSLTSLDEDSVRIINLNMKDKEFSFGTGKNEAIIHLNPNPLWDINMKSGAAEINADFTGLKVSTVQFEGGASKLSIRIGKLYPLTNISLKSGVTSITIEIPKESGCEFHNKGALTKKGLDGFIKTGDGLFLTPDFKKSTNKVIVISESAVSELNIVQY